MAKATISTDKGDIEVDIFTTGAPKAAKNFLDLAKKGFYDGVIFHRIVPGFVIQGGDPTGTGRGGPGYQFEDEPFEGDYYRGTLAMANAGPNTNGSQFFICSRRPDREAAEELHDLRAGHEGHGRRRPDRGRPDRRPGPAGRAREDDDGDRVGGVGRRSGLRPGPGSVGQSARGLRLATRAPRRRRRRGRTPPRRRQLTRRAPNVKEFSRDL